MVVFLLVTYVAYQHGGSSKIAVMKEYLYGYSSSAVEEKRDSIIVTAPMIYEN